MVRKRTKIILGVLLLFVAGVTIAGTLIGNEVSASIGGRIVWAESAHALSKAQVSVDSSEAVVLLGDKRITVTQDRVVLPDGASLVVPARCKRIALSESGDGVRVRLDGVPAN